MAGYHETRAAIFDSSAALRAPDRNSRLETCPRTRRRPFLILGSVWQPGTREMAWAAIIGCAGRAGQIPFLLFVLVFSDCAATEVVFQDLSARVAVVFDVTTHSFWVIQIAPCASVHLH